MPQKELIAGYLEPMLSFIFDAMDLSHAECPTKPGVTVALTESS